MKTFRLLLICTVLLLLATAAQAQNSDQPIRVDVPFTFQVGNAQFPAGDYTINQTADRMRIVNLATGQHGVFVKMNAVRNSKELPGALQFVLRGDNHILTNVWKTGLESGATLIN